MWDVLYGSYRGVPREVRGGGLCIFWKWEKSEKVSGGETVIRKGLQNQELEQDFEKTESSLKEKERKMIERTLANNIKEVAEERNF